jgi:hypothetical protein
MVMVSAVLSTHDAGTLGHRKSRNAMKTARHHEQLIALELTNGRQIAKRTG